MGRPGPKLDRRVGGANTSRRRKRNVLIPLSCNTFLAGEGLGLVRPRFLAIAFFGFFASVGYLAYSFAHRASQGAYSPEISRAVYQTTMLGGLVVLIGLFLTASILPHLARAWGPRGSTSSIGGRGRSPETLTLSAFPPPSRIPRNPDSQWAVDGLLEESGEDPSPYMDLRRKRDAAAVSAALSRLLPTTDATSPGKMMDRLAGIRARKGGLLPEDREMTQVLLRLVDEIKPLLVAAKKAGLNVPEIRRVVADATSGREGDLTYRVRVVEQLKDTLESSLVEHIAQDLQSVLVDIEHTKVATQQVHAAELTAAEGVALLDTGNYSAAIDRVARARETIGTSLANVGLPPAEGESGNSAPLSIVPLVGPSIVACLYVAIGAILLPGSDAFLTTYYIANTTAILFVSYGWFGLILYSLLSVYILARSSFLRGIDYEVPLDGI